MRLLFVPPLLCVGFGVVLQPPSVSVPMPRHSHASSQSKMLPSLHSPSAPSTAVTHEVFGAVWSPEEEVMGISVSSDGRCMESLNHSSQLGRSPFVFQGAANSCWSQDLLVRQEGPWGDDLNVCVYRNV